MTGRSGPGADKLRKPLFLCGILSSLFYVAMNIIVPMGYEGYSSVSHTISELSAIGAPTRTLWVALGLVYTLLVTAFGWGVWMSAKGNSDLRVVGGLVIAYGLSGIAWPFAPMHQREVLAAGGSNIKILFVLAGLTAYTQNRQLWGSSLLYGMKRLREILSGFRVQLTQ